MRPTTRWWLLLNLTFITGFGCGRYDNVFDTLAHLLIVWLQK